MKNVDGVYGEEIAKARVLLVKHFVFVLGTKPTHSQGIVSVSVTKTNVERQFVQIQVENA